MNFKRKGYEKEMRSEEIKTYSSMSGAGRSPEEIGYSKAYSKCVFPLLKGESQ